MYINIYLHNTVGGFEQAAFITDSIVSLIELTLFSVAGVFSEGMGWLSFEQPK